MDKNRKNKANNGKGKDNQNQEKKKIKTRRKKEAESQENHMKYSLDKSVVDDIKINSAPLNLFRGLLKQFLGTGFY